VEFDSVDERVVVYRTGVRGAAAQRLAVRLSRSPEVLRGDRRERDEVDDLHLDDARPDPIARPAPARGHSAAGAKPAMNWIFEAYSNVYKVVMLRNTDHPILFASIRETTKPRSHRRLSRSG